MGVSAMFAVAAVGAAAAVDQHQSAKQARKTAEEQAALERQSLADLQAEEKPVIPLGDDAATKRARRRSIASQMQRRGRQSTILTGDTTTSDTLGAS